MAGPPVTVVGAGIAGLAAAHRLCSLGHAVTVVEAGERAGGKLVTTPFAGRQVDEAADAFLLRVPEAIDLCRTLGLDHQLVHPAARHAYVATGGALRPLPPQLLGVPIDVGATAATSILSAAAVARLRDSDSESAGGGTGAGPLTGPDTTIGAEIERRLGAEVLDRLVDPLVGGINAGDTRRLSLAAVVPQLDAVARDPDHQGLVAAARAAAQRAAAVSPDRDQPIFAAHPDGMAAIVDALVAAMPSVAWRTGRRAVGITPLARGDGRWRVELDDGASVDGDLVLAVPAPVAAALVRELAPVAAGHLASIEHASVALVALAVAPDALGRALDGSGFLVPRVDGRLLTACSWASTKWAHLAPERADGTAVLRASAGRAGDQRALDLDDADLVARLVDDLAATMDLAGAPTEVRVSRWTDGFPQYAPGHLDRVDELQRDLSERAPGLAVAGAALRGVGIPACIRSGTEAARRVAAGEA